MQTVRASMAEWPESEVMSSCFVQRVERIEEATAAAIASMLSVPASM